MTLILLGGMGRIAALRAVAVAGAALLDRGVFLRRAAGAAHRGVALDDDLARVGMAIGVGLDAAARVVLHVERVHVALLLRRARVLVLIRPGPLPPVASSLMPGSCSLAGP